MSDTFRGCTSLTTAPTIPSSVTNMYETFWECTSLTTAPTIPNSVTDMSYTFYYCASLTGEVEINANSLEDYECCFEDITEPIILTGTCPILNEIASRLRFISFRA